MATNEQQAWHDRLANDVAHQGKTYDGIFELFCQMVSPLPVFPCENKHSIFFALATRCIETANAVRVLIDHQTPMVEDASALVRILTESTITASFIAVKNDSMAERFDAWGDYFAAKQELLSLKAFPKPDPAEHSKELDEWESIKSQVLERFPEFKKPGDFWKNVFERAKEVDEDLGDPAIRDFAELNETIKPLSNYVHQNALAVRKRIKIDDCSVSIGREYSDADKANVLYACNQALFAFCLILDATYWAAKNANRWNELRRAWQPYNFAAPSTSM